MPWVRMPAPRRAPANYLMADLSANNGPPSVLNAMHYASSGHLAIAIKATEGTGYINPDHAAQAADAHAHRLGVVHYHFADLSNPAAEARHFWDVTRPHYHAHAADRLVVDLEVGNQARWPGWLEAFDAELYRYSTLAAIVYTFAAAPLAELRLRSRECWLAAWGAKQPSGAFRRLPGGATLWGWQMYGGGALNPSGGPTGAVGVVGHCDMSVLNPAFVRALKKANRR